jgi:hypothetical protein
LTTCTVPRPAMVNRPTGTKVLLTTVHSLIASSV